MLKLVIWGNNQNQCGREPRAMSVRRAASRPVVDRYGVMNSLTGRLPSARLTEILRGRQAASKEGSKAAPQTNRMARRVAPAGHATRLRAGIDRNRPMRNFGEANYRVAV